MERIAGLSALFIHGRLNISDSRRRHRSALGALAVVASLCVVSVLPGQVLANEVASRTSSCPSNLADDLAAQPGSAELITVVSATARSDHALLETWQRAGPCYKAVGGPFPAHVGISGLSTHHEEGDGTTPEGVFDIGPVIYGVRPNPGVHFDYHQLVCGDWWDEDPRSGQYNTFQHRACGSAPGFGGASEALWRTTPAYDYFAVIDYNDAPVLSGRGSGIFLHLSTGGPTVGCVSLDQGALLQVLRWMLPAEHPQIVIGTESKFASM